MCIFVIYVEMEVDTFNEVFCALIFCLQIKCHISVITSKKEGHVALQMLVFCAFEHFAAKWYSGQ